MQVYMQQVCNRSEPFTPPNYFTLYKYFEYITSGPHAKVLVTLLSVERSSPFIHQRLYSPSLGPGLFFLLRRTGSLDGGSARRKATTYTQDNTNTERTNIHALSGIRTHDPRVRASEDSLCLRPRGHCDRPV
jgi:hypothetical protein